MEAVNASREYTVPWKPSFGQTEVAPAAATQAPTVWAGCWWSTVRCSGRLGQTWPVVGGGWCSFGSREKQANCLAAKAVKAHHAIDRTLCVLHHICKRAEKTTSCMLQGQGDFQDRCCNNLIIYVLGPVPRWTFQLPLLSRHKPAKRRPGSPVPYPGRLGTRLTDCLKD